MLILHFISQFCLLIWPHVGYVGMYNISFFIEMSDLRSSWPSCLYLVYTEFILVQLFRRLLAHRNTMESVPGTNQYWTMGVKFLAKGNNSLPLTRFEPMRLAKSEVLITWLYVLEECPSSKYRKPVKMEFFSCRSGLNGHKHVDVHDLLMKKGSCNLSWLRILMNI